MCPFSSNCVILHLEGDFMEQIKAYFDLIVFSSYFAVIKEVVLFALVVFVVYRIFTYQTRKMKLKEKQEKARRKELQKAETKRHKELQKIEKIRNKRLAIELKNIKNSVEKDA